MGWNINNLISHVEPLAFAKPADSAASGVQYVIFQQFVNSEGGNGTLPLYEWDFSRGWFYGRELTTSDVGAPLVDQFTDRSEWDRGAGHPRIGEYRVWVALGLGNGHFADPIFALEGYGYDAGWHLDGNPRFVADLTSNDRADLVVLGDVGVRSSLGNGLCRFLAKVPAAAGFRVRNPVLVKRFRRRPASAVFSWPAGRAEPAST